MNKISVKHSDSQILPVFGILRVTVFMVFVLCQSGILSGQSIFLSHNGMDVTNKEVTAEGKATEDELKVYLVIANTSAKSVLVKVRKTEYSVIQGSLNSFCLGVCYAPFVYESAYPVSIAAGKSTKDSLFSVFYDPGGFAGKSVIKYDVFDISDPENNKASVTVNFIGNSPGTGIEIDIAGIETMRVYPNPCSGDRITFRLPGAVKSNNGRIAILTCTGNIAGSIPLIDCAGDYSVPVGDYPGGVYFYSFMNKGKLLCSGKFIINH